MALATIADVEARLGRELTTSEDSQATAWLTDASAMFVQRARQKFEVSESTVRLFPRDGIVRLVQRPVIEVTSVTDIDGSEIDFTYDGHQSIYELGTYSPVIVTYDHGSDTIPEDVVAVVAGMVVRTLLIPDDAAAGIQQQSVGPFSQSYANWAVGRQVLMSPSDIEVANYYREKTFRSASTIGNGNYGVYYPNPTKFELYR
ncbi:MAG TPA: hypothetical protein VKP88_01855 [Candidatus Paceibacterota bacterium]|nr:hypothetical protein [Candidatus Paceibacterota bacterium]